MSPKSKTPQTLLIHSGQVRSPFEETSEALYLTSGFVYPNAKTAADAFADRNEHYIYSRYANPTVKMFETKAATLEQAPDCIATASGMAAVFAAMMCQLKSGDEVVASDALFGSCDHIIRNILPQYGILVKRVAGGDLTQWQKAITTKTKLVFFETPANPTLDLVDIQAVSDIAHNKGAKVLVDNVFATSIFQKPMQLGADIVIYSATKHIDGQGRALGGLVLGSVEFCRKVLLPFIRNTGPSLSPFNAWVLLKGMETLKLRVEKQSETAQAVVEFLQQSPKIAKVFYPTLHPLYKKQMTGGGTVVSFTLKNNTTKNAFKFIDALELIKISNNLGDSRSLVTHPATTTHHRLGAEGRKQMGITDGMVRISVGLEEISDILDDISRALRKL